jgi:PAS domain S-box-containing protein
MKLKTQFIICIIVFSAVLLIIGASVAATEQQVANLNSQIAISNKFERGASSLNSVSIDYFLYQEDLQISRWETALSALRNDLANLKVDTAQQQMLKDNIASDLQNLDANFNEVAAYLQGASRNVSVRIDPAFQIRWSSMAVQSNALAFDASRLSQSIDKQADQANNTNTVLIVSLVSAFGAFLAIIYLIVFRRTLKSVTKLQKGINIIGTGNLDHAIEIEGKNEITDLTYAFNQMTANLKTVTASKTDLEMAQASLRESEQRWATTLASIGDAVIATDLSGRIVFMNGVAEALTGWTKTEASQKPLKDIFNIINEQTRIEVENPVAKVLDKGVIVGLANHTILIRKDKTEVAIDDSGAPIKDKDGKTTGVVLIFRDITERKQMTSKLEEYAQNLERLVAERTEALKDAERLAAIGATAGMVGHDIRNPLQAITSDIFLLKSDLTELLEGEKKEIITESLEDIEKNVEYINKIVRDLQDFARPITPNVKETDVEKILSDVLVKKAIPANIRVSCKVEAEAKRLITDPDFLRRISFNLVNNAIQAMPKGGKLSVNAFSKGNEVIITVRDNGDGIPEEVKPKLFTPLFTTKSKGQGFGLAVVKRLTEALGGTVTFESERGKGTTFIVCFPQRTRLQ